VGFTRGFFSVPPNRAIFFFFFINESAEVEMGLVAENCVFRKKSSSFFFQQLRRVILSYGDFAVTIRTGRFEHFYQPQNCRLVDGCAPYLVKIARRRLTVSASLS